MLGRVAGALGCDKGKTGEPKRLKGRLIVEADHEVGN
jgi:hypothetical protein